MFLLQPVPEEMESIRPPTDPNTPPKLGVCWRPDHPPTFIQGTSTAPYLSTNVEQSSLPDSKSGQLPVMLELLDPDDEDGAEEAAAFVDEDEDAGAT